MIRTDLIDIINSGNAWGFIGSGISADAGSLSWKMLLETILNSIDKEQREIIELQTKFQKGLASYNFPSCFSVIENYIARGELERLTVNELKKTQSAGKLALRIADLPFKAFVTTNYDNLIEDALDILEQPGWIPVGNTEDEIKKVSGDASKIIWHVHGAIDLDKSKSKLILTEEDYDSIYINRSATYEQLRAVLTQHRIVFWGFSFQDADVKRLLRVVGNLCTPERPAYAFLSDISGIEYSQERMDLRLKYNIEVIPYITVDNSHKRLHELLDVYESMILRRSLRFGQSMREVPSYTEETTGLLLFNEFSLKKHEGLSDEISTSLLRSRILSILRFRKKVKLGDLIDELNERMRLLQGGTRSKDSIETLIIEIVKELVGASLVQYVAEASEILLTEEGNVQVSQQSAIAERVDEQFMASLNFRARKLLPDDVNMAKKVATLAGSFLKDSVKKHSLGVALVLYNPTKPQQEYQMIALLRSLPEYVEQAASQKEANALIHLIQNILSSPNSIEKNYIGLSLQAQFGVHLLGFDRATIQLRVDQIKKTIFLIDSSTLIPFLARSCIGHESARKVISLLKANGASVVTTDLLSAEVSEHVCWAINNSGKMAGTFKTYAVSMGHAGYGSNAFLEGFLEEVRQGIMPPYLNNYLLEVCNKPSDKVICNDNDVIETLKKYGLAVQKFSDWHGFVAAEMYELRNEYVEKIAALRREAGNFKHYRQVKAEAEALIIVQKFREKVFSYEDKEINDAFFVSNTRIINQVDSNARGNSITMNADSIITWLSTMAHHDPMEMGFLYEGMLWELHEKGFSIIDKTKLRSVFAPLIHASKEQLQELMDNHKSLIAEIYGENPEKAFNEVDDLNLPIILESIHLKRAEALEKELREEKRLRENALAKAALSKKEKQELTILREDKKRRSAKVKSQKRAAESQKKKKKGNKRGDSKP